MVDRIPVSLYITNRAQCPDCGAPLSLLEGHLLVTCAHCGGASAVERRLRTLEVSIENMQTAAGPTHRTPAHQIVGVQSFQANCPTCGMLMETDSAHAILRCAHCGVESKFERRLVRRGASGTLALEELSSAWSKNDPYAKKTEILVQQIIVEQNALDRLSVARQFEQWVYINPTAAKHLPMLLEIMRVGGPALEMQLGDMLGKLLCEGDIGLRNAVIRAAEEFVFDVGGSKELLFALGLGSGVGVKLLLDAADYAADQGAMEYACAALWAVNLIFERFYGDRDRMAEIVLYRLLYLRGPVMAWALELAQGHLGLGYRYPTATLLRFMDDCHYERPELLRQIEQCFYNGNAVDELEYRARLDVIASLITPRAKAAGLRVLYSPPVAASDAFLAAAVQEILGYAKNPIMEEGASAALNWIVALGDGVPGCIERMVEEHGDTLPEDVRRAYVDRAGESPHLGKLPRRYWKPEVEPLKTGLEAKLDEWNSLWKGGILDAVAARGRRQDAYRTACVALNERGH